MCVCVCKNSAVEQTRCGATSTRPNGVEHVAFQELQLIGIFALAA